MDRLSAPENGHPAALAFVDRKGACNQETLATRPAPQNPAHAGLVFITKYPMPWFKASSDNPIAKEIAKLLSAVCFAKSSSTSRLTASFEYVG